MLPSIMPTQRHFMQTKQPERGLGLLLRPLHISSGKSFTNPNFVNKFNRSENVVKQNDVGNKETQYCQYGIIANIKENCPDVIPSTKKPDIFSPDSSNMCLDVEKSIMQIKDHIGKHPSKHGEKRIISEMLDEEYDQDKSHDLSEIHSSSHAHKPNLENLHSPPSTMVKSIELPLSNAEMVLAITKSFSPKRTCQYSTSDSEDSFIIFDYEGKDQNHYRNKELLCNRDRQPSLCESEESFIIFEGGDDVSQNDDESEYYYDTSDEETEESDFEDILNKNNSCDDTDSSYTIIEPKKVRFACDQKLCEVHPMIKWSYAYQAARKGPWEMYARDRCRFKERATRIERDIKHIFEPQNRERIYRERFMDH